MLIGPALLTVLNADLPDAVAGTAYSYECFSTGGVLPCTYAATGLPAGLTINTATGRITGTPTTAGTNAVTITATDANGQTASTTGKHITVAANPNPLPTGVAARYIASSITPVANGAPVTAWPDSSGNGYNATQAVAANQPQYVIAAQTIAGLAPGVWFGAGTGNATQTGGNSQTFLTIPAALATNQQNVTIFVIGEGGFSNGQAGPMVGLGASSGIGPANLQNTLGYHQGGAFHGVSVADLGTGPFAYCLQSSATALTLTRSFSSASAAALTSAALAGGALGSGYAAAASGGSLFGYQGMLQEVFIYPRVLTSGELAQLFAYAATQYGTATAKRPINLVWYGNSVFLEWGASTDGGMTADVAKRPATSYSLASGANTSSLGSGFAQQLSGIAYTKSLYDASATANIVCLYDGDTDMTNGLTAQQIYNNQQQIAQALQAVGFKVVSSSLTNHNYSGAQLTEFNAYNALLRATPIGDAFADIGADPAFATYTPAYMSDTSHPNNAGHAIMAGIYATAIQAILSGTPPTLRITSNAMPSGVVGTSYSAQQTASGGVAPYSYAATGLPAGLVINSATGAITGTPTTAGGPTSVVVTATDSTAPTRQSASSSGLTITITSGAQPLTITNNAFPNGAVGTGYSFGQTASGGAGPYTYTSTPLPAGLSINPSTGMITGTPTAAVAASAVTVTVTDSTTPTHLTASTSGLTITITATTGVGTISPAHINLGADLSGASGVYNFTAPAAGNAMIFLFQFRSTSTDSITSITGLGTASHVTAARSVSGAGGRATDVWQCLSVPAGVTSVTINQTGTGVVTVVGIELHATAGSFILDTASAVTNASASASPVAGGPITTSGAKSFVISYMASSVLGGDGTCAAPLTFTGADDGHGNQIYTAANIAPQSFTPTVGAINIPGPYSLSTGAWTTV
jgi:lysophospholipase L1-like esterase